MRCPDCVTRVLALLCLAGCFGMHAFAGGKVVVLGSSTAQGVGASAYSNAWVGLLGAALGRRGWVVVNTSIGGTGTAQSLARFDLDVAPHYPDYVVFATSIVNDPGSTPEEKADVYLKNTRALIRKAEAIGAVPVVVAPYPANEFTARMYAAVQRIYGVLEGEGVAVLDFLDAGDDGSGRWLHGLAQDGTHPNDVGHQLLFDAIPLTMFDQPRKSQSAPSARGYGAWVHNGSLSSDGWVRIAPPTPAASWTVAFWVDLADSARDRVLAAVNGGALQVRTVDSRLALWRGETQLAAGDLATAGGLRHIALTYQAYNGVARLLVDGALQMDVVVPGLEAGREFYLGGLPGIPSLNALGDIFADALLYRAPLKPADVSAIAYGRTPWKSVEAWVPMSSSAERSILNLAGTQATVSIAGRWDWTARGIRISGGDLPERSFRDRPRSWR